MNVTEAFLLALRDVESTLPRVILSIVILLAFFIIAVLINRVFSRLLEIVRIDEFLGFEKYTGIQFSSLLLAIANAVIVLTAIYTVASVAFPSSLPLVNSVVEYAARIISVIFLISVVFVAVSRMTEKVAVSGKIKDFMTLVMLFIVLVLLIDVTNLTPEVKSALAWGLSVGIGISIGIFTFWYFFEGSMKKY